MGIPAYHLFLGKQVKNEFIITLNLKIKGEKCEMFSFEDFTGIAAMLLWKSIQTYSLVTFNTIKLFNSYQNVFQF